MRTLDCYITAAYLLAVCVIGIACRGKKQSVDEYFTAHGSFKGWLGTTVIGLSIAASYFSAISFIIYSSSAYSYGGKVLFSIISVPIGYLVIRYLFLDRYLAATGRHPYGIVESRLGYPTRACLSGMFVLMRIGWIAMVIYAPTLVIMGSLGLGESGFWPVLLIVGLVCTLFTAIGGIRGVIVTDAIQFLVMALGVILVIVLVLVRLHLSGSAILADLSARDHLRLMDFSTNLAVPWTVWTIILSKPINSISPYMSDQMALQRFLTSDSRRDVYRSLLINMWGVVTVMVLLVVMGTLLSVWYWHHPDPSLPRNVDQILPYFATRQLPVGMSGLLIAAILAATMNTMTSGVNSLAGAITNDFVARLGRPRSGAELFRIGRATSVGIGVLATALAGFARNFSNLFQADIIIMGVFMGPMMACMMWALYRGTVRPAAVLTGMLVGPLAAAAVGASGATGFWVTPAGFLVAFLIPLADCALTRGRAPNTPRQNRSG